jgi:hypothetical protein
MRNINKTPSTSTLSTSAIGALVAAATLGHAAQANAGVVGCSAPGGKQEAGAVIGALLGGFVGNQVGGRRATGETVAGAAVGAAAGSAIGCEAQKTRQGTYSSGYSHDGVRLRANVRAAEYDRMNAAFVADPRVNIRSAPSAGSARLGSLSRGERFQALARVEGSDWILVGRNGVGVGYVREDFVRPVGQRYASY